MRAMVERPTMLQGVPTTGCRSTASSAAARLQWCDDSVYLQEVLRDGVHALEAATCAVAQFETWSSDVMRVEREVHVKVSSVLAPLMAGEVGIVRMWLLSHGFDPRPRPGPPGYVSRLDVTTDWLWMGRFTVAARSAVAWRSAKEVARHTAVLLQRVRRLRWPGDEYGGGPDRP